MWSSPAGFFWPPHPVSCLYPADRSLCHKTHLDPLKLKCQRDNGTQPSDLPYIALIKTQCLHWDIKNCVTYCTADESSWNQHVIWTWRLWHLNIVLPLKGFATNCWYEKFWTLFRLRHFDQSILISHDPKFSWRDGRWSMVHDVPRCLFWSLEFGFWPSPSCFFGARSDHIWRREQCWANAS